MKTALKLLILIVLLQSCTNNEVVTEFEPVNWDKRTPITMPADSLLVSGSTYLSVYSQIYSQNEHRVLDLTATVSMRNTNKEDTIYVESAEYYGTSGKPIRSYFDHPIFIKPMETIEIVITQSDIEGGTGGNFLFDWKTLKRSHEPLFESVRLSAAGSQVVSFTTNGKRLD
jgi:hypothetical protein